MKPYEIFRYHLEKIREETRRRDRDRDKLIEEQIKKALDSKAVEEQIRKTVEAAFQRMGAKIT